jgi:DNA-binding LacI/PurR family transcriptional regulator
MKSIEQKIKEKGVTKSHVAKMVGTSTATLSRIIAKKQQYVSQTLEDKIHFYLDSINTSDKNILKNMSK